MTQEKPNRLQFPMCGHPELIPICWNQPKPEPCQTIGTCPVHDYACPVCGVGVGCAPPCDCLESRSEMTLKEERRVEEIRRILDDLVCSGYGSMPQVDLNRDCAQNLLALIRDRVEKIRAENPYDIAFWKVDAETLMVTHRTTGYCMTDRERQNAYVVFDEACHEVLRMLKE